MYQPEELKTDKRLKWSTGRGVDVWDLFCRCRDGDLVGVQRLIQRDPSLVRSHCSYRTGLYFAVIFGQLAVAEYLLNAQADPLAMEFGDSLLVQADDRGNSQMVELLTDHLARRNRFSPWGEQCASLIRSRQWETLFELLDQHPEAIHHSDRRSNQPIHWAVMTRQIPLIDELVKRGADLTAKRQDGARPIHLFNGDYYYRGWRDVPDDCPYGKTEVLDHLLKIGAPCDMNTACHRGDIETVRRLLAEDSASANRLSEQITYYLGSGSPLDNATVEGHIEIVRLLLDHGADPNLEEVGIAPNGKALYSAAAYGHFEIAKLLLQHRAFPNPAVESSGDALSRAIGNDDKPMIELLCSYGASQENHILAYYGDTRTFAARLDANPSLANDPDALANAAGEGHLAIVRLILRYSSNLPKKLSFPGWLVCGKTREINQLLIDHGMDPNHTDWMGATVLHQLASSGRTEMAEFFLDNGADINVRDDALQSTPLGWAAKHGKLEMVELLLRRGALPRHPEDPDWASPLAWATRRGHHELAERLKTKGKM
jgi:ankyrin repeat protein